MAARLGWILLGLAVAGAALAYAARWGDGPLGPLPGGPFRGEARACTGVEWERFAGTRELELEVHAASPRTLTTWSLVHEGRLHVPADFLTPWKRWPAQVLADPRVRLRLGGEVFRCRAERVSDPETIEALRRAIAEKYDLDPEGRAARVEVWWFRVVPG